MLNLDPNDAIHYTSDQQREINNLLANKASRTGGELWDEKGPNDVFVGIKDDIRRHNLQLQKVRCAFCETVLQYGGVQIEHFVPKWFYSDFLYEPLNLVCSCPVCNGFANKGKRITINKPVNAVYGSNEFKYVHPFLHDVDKEIKYRDPFRIIVDKARSSDIGKSTIEMFHWDTLHAKKKRLSNLLFWSTKKSRQIMIEEILGFKG